MSWLARDRTAEPKTRESERSGTNGDRGAHIHSSGRTGYETIEAKGKMEEILLVARESVGIACLLCHISSEVVVTVTTTDPFP